MPEYPLWWFGAYLLLCLACFVTIPRVHPYDRCMAITSLYVLLAASHVNVPYMFSAMAVTTFASIMHWVYYENKVLHRADILFSLGVFLWNVWVLVFSWPEQATQALAAAAASATLFKARVGTREKALQRYRLLYVLPHTSFRFFAFWFVMLLHGQPWSWGLSLYYWGTVVLLAWPSPMPSGQSLERFFS
jgi:hypothetical protein